MKYDDRAAMTGTPDNSSELGTPDNLAGAGWAVMLLKTVQLDWLLNYELQLAERYRRYVTLVLVTSSINAPRLPLLFCQALRDCDAIYNNNESISVVMPDTQMTEALIVVDRLRQLCGQDAETFFSVATYPQDGVLPARLLAKAQERLKLACASSPGTVVCTDE